MAIEKTKSYKCSDGSVFLNEAEAQVRELEILLGVDVEDGGSVNEVTNSAIKSIVAKKTEVLAILSTRKARTPKVKSAKAKKEQVAA